MPRRRRTHKFVSTIIFLILLAVAGVIGYLVYQSYFSKNPTHPKNTTTQAVKQEDNPTIPAKEAAREAVTPTEDTKTPIKYDGGDPNKNTTLTGAVTYANKNGDKLTIRVNIDQYITSGVCNLIVSQDDATIYDTTARLINSASTSTCEGFDVPATNLSGKYLITINLASDTKTGKITKEVNL